jgi:hypothetical protein
MKSLYREPCFCLAFLWRCAHVGSSRAFAAKSSSAMFFDPTDEQRLASLEQRLGLAQAITPELMSDVIAQGESGHYEPFRTSIPSNRKWRPPRR